MSVTLKSIAKALLLAAAVAVVGAAGLGGCGGDDSYPVGNNTDGNGVDDGSGGGGLVGDWMMYSSILSYNGEIVQTNYASDHPDEKRLLSFRSSGDASVWGFSKVGNVWVETSFENGEVVKWRADGQTIYIRGDGWSGEQAWGTYTISGDRLIVTTCGWRDYDDTYYDPEVGGYIDSVRHVYRCEETTLTRVNVDDIRKSLGTVYINNPNLRGDWVLEVCDIDPYYGDYSCNERYLHIGSSYFDGSGIARYVDVGGGNYYGDYYTSGNNLFLAVETCDWDEYTGEHCTTAQPIMLRYSVSGSGNNRTLTINGDVWRIRPDDDYYKGPDPATSSQSKRSTAPGVGWWAVELSARH